MLLVVSGQERSVFLKKVQYIPGTVGAEVKGNRATAKSLRMVHKNIHDAAVTGRL